MRLRSSHLKKLIFSAFLLCTTSSRPPEWPVSENDLDSEDGEGNGSGDLDQLPKTIHHLKDGIGIDQEINEEKYGDGSKEPVATGHDIGKNFSHGGGVDFGGESRCSSYIIA